MGDEIQVVPAQVIAVGFVRLRAGAKPGPNGEVNPADYEAVISLQMGCVRQGGLVGPDGKQTGHMVPVGEVCRPLAEIKAEAAMRFEHCAGLRRSGCGRDIPGSLQCGTRMGPSPSDVVLCPSCYEARRSPHFMPPSKEREARRAEEVQPSVPASRAAELATLHDRRRVYIEYARHRIDDGDWHGVSDAANDLRELDVEIRMLEAAKP